jgi:catechol 2,3-dioxygenase-like lactoylglutathione lyase family enzyme
MGTYAIASLLWSDPNFPTAGTNSQSGSLREEVLSQPAGVPIQAEHGWGFDAPIHYDPPMTAKVTGLIPMAFVADVQRSIDFYALLNLKVRNIFKNDGGQLVWAHVECEHAELMFSLATDPVIPSQQAVLFYMYSPNLIALREHLLAKGVKASPITYPHYMPKGEIRVEDPDGYVLLLGQSD